MRGLGGVISVIGALALCGAIASCTRDETSSREQAAAPLAQEPESPSSAAAASTPSTAGGQAAATGQGASQDPALSCPMVVAGAEVAVSDTPSGVALTFTTAQGDVGELRRRVQNLGQMYEMHAAGGGMMWRHMGRMGGPGPGMGGGMMGPGSPMPAVRVTVTDVAQGARLELIPADASQLDAVRQRVRMHQQRMHSGQCWMAQSGAGTSPGTSPAKP